MKQTVLITGASSGIGLELARLFAKDGYNLVLVARNQAKLEALAEALRAGFGVEARVMVQDLAKTEAPQQIVEELDSQGIEIDILVNNAGTQVYGKFAETATQQQLDLAQVNVNALVHLTHLLLPGMVQRGRGRILNLGSTGSFTPGPLNAVYCAGKAFVLSFSEAIGAELAGSGVTVTALCPGSTDTAFVTRHGMQDVRLFRSMMSARRVAEIGYQAMQRGWPVVVTGLGNQLMVLLFQLSAPFIGIMPPKLFMTFGGLFMGRSN
jgi:short-subunit dehydrogenase